MRLNINWFKEITHNIFILINMSFDMLNFDVKEMIYNHLKDDDGSDYDSDYNEQQTFYDDDEEQSAYDVYMTKTPYYNVEVSNIIKDSMKLKNNKLIINDEEDTINKLSELQKDNYKDFITDKFKVDYKKLIFDNELRTNKMKIVKKYTDKDLLKDINIGHIIQYREIRDRLLKTCNWCSNCKKVIEYDAYLHNNIKLDNKCCCERCVNISTTITNKFIFHFRDELIDYNNFFYNNNIFDNWSGYNIEDDNDFDLNEKEKIINVIHNHNISVILNNDKKYTKKVLLDEMSKYHKYFKIIVELYEESDIDTNTDSEEDIDEQNLDL